MTSLADFNIKINLLENPGEKKVVVIEGVGWNEAVCHAIECRKTRPLEPVEILPVDAGNYTVVRCVR